MTETADTEPYHCGKFRVVYLLEVLEHEPALLDPSHDGGKVVVQQHNVRTPHRVRVSSLKRIYIIYK